MLTAKLKRVILPFFLVGAFVVFSQLASTAQAMCVYNDTTIKIDVEFDCGIFCDNSWSTEPNNSYCRPDKSGTINTDWFCCNGAGGRVPRISMQVDAHGYVVLSWTDSSQTVINVCVYHEDDSLAGCQSFSP